MGRIILNRNESTRTAATIDIDEPIGPVPAGGSRVVGYTYTAGDPPAFAFLVEWFRSEADAETNRNQLYPIQFMLPTYEIQPAVPIAGAVDARGTIALTMPTVDDVFNPFIPATIDIDEPIVIRTGETKQVLYTYLAGDPPAYAFLVEWFRSEADAEANRHQLTQEIPIATLEPGIPVDAPGLQNGRMHLHAPSTTAGMVFYGKLSICQKDPWIYFGKLSICQGTVIDIPQTSLSQNNRRTANVWSDWRRR